MNTRPPDSPARLGFGTAGISIAAPREAHRLLETAWDCGIRYFDTAPLYAYGEAEKLLGQLLRGRQDQATICTKVGLYPPRLSLCGLSLSHRGVALVKKLASNTPNRYTLAQAIDTSRRTLLPLRCAPCTVELRK